MEIVKFYQEGGGGDVWDKMGAALNNSSPTLPPQPPQKPLMDESLYSSVSLHMTYILLALTVPHSVLPHLRRKNHTLLESHHLRQTRRPSQLLPQLIVQPRNHHLHLLRLSTVHHQLETHRPSSSRNFLGPTPLPPSKSVVRLCRRNHHRHPHLTTRFLNSRPPPTPLQQIYR